MTKPLLRPLAVSIVLAGWAGFAQAGAMDTISIDGYFSLEYEHSVAGDKVNRTGKQMGDPNGSFDTDGLDLVINAQPDPRVRLSTDITFEHGAATEDGLGNVAVEYAFAEYTAADWLRIRAGKMFIHFGIYNDYHTAKPAFLSVKEPYSVGKTDKTGNDLRFYPRWGSGLGLLGDFRMANMDAEYAFQITNGDIYTFDDANGGLPDVNSFEDDEEESKAINGRLRVSPSDDLRLGLSFYVDEAAAFGSYCGAVIAPDCPAVTAPMTGTYEVQSIGLEAEWRTVWKSFVQAEYVQGNTTFVDDAAAGSFDVDRTGWYLMVSRPVSDSVTGYLRYEGFEPDDATSDDEMTIGVAGINWNVGKGAHVKLELDQYNSENNNGKLKGGEYTELKAAFAIGF
jgi:hypothetical protein